MSVCEGCSGIDSRSKGVLDALGVLDERDGTDRMAIAAANHMTRHGRSPAGAESSFMRC